jgi:hypothetical protein
VVVSVGSVPGLYDEGPTSAEGIVHGFQPSVCIRLYKKIVQETAEAIQNQENEHVRGIEQSEARH